MKHLFKNDYNFLIHPRLLEALNKYNDVQHEVYGLDIHSSNAEKYIKSVFNIPNSSVYFLAGGTQTNLVFISKALKSYEGVLALETGHINVHESGAIEGSGHKIFTVKGKDGKMYPEDIACALNINNNEHTLKIKLVYISNSTEIGTIYTKQELINLHKCCLENNLYLYIDGARLASALTSDDNDVPLELLGEICDGFSIGGTKNGFLFGEALVVNNKIINEDFRYHIKNKGAMLAKGYAVGIQFEEAFKDNFYFELGRKTNEVANYLKDGLRKLNLKMDYSPTNQIFVEFDKEKAETLMNEYGLELWTDKGDKLVVRFVISFLTSKSDCDELINYIRNMK